MMVSPKTLKYARMASLLGLKRMGWIPSVVLEIGTR